MSWKAYFLVLKWSKSPINVLLVLVLASEVTFGPDLYFSPRGWQRWRLQATAFPYIPKRCTGQFLAKQISFTSIEWELGLTTLPKSKGKCLWRLQGLGKESINSLPRTSFPTDLWLCVLYRKNTFILLLHVNFRIMVMLSSLMLNFFIYHIFIYNSER